MTIPLIDFETGKGSPVIKDSSTVLDPNSMIPSILYKD